MRIQARKVRSFAVEQAGVGLTGRTARNPPTFSTRKVRISTRIVRAHGRRMPRNPTGSEDPFCLGTNSLLRRGHTPQWRGATLPVPVRARITGTRRLDGGSDLDRLARID